MSDWTSGYVAEIDYTHGYYRELAPSLLALAALNQRISLPVTGQPLRYLELGFGQGLSLAIHAAACPGEYWGTDFNPAHAVNARELTSAAGIQAHIFDSSFADLACNDSLPEFDVIALHGIWSWISEENRRTVVDLVRRKLAVGGMLYISYNCTPGWSPAIPLRHLMTLHAELGGAKDKGITARIDEAIGFTQQVVDSGALYFKANSAVANRLQQLKAMNRNYLAHEYFNKDWDPMPFSQVAGLLSSAKVTFAASANLLDHVDQINLTTEGQKLLADIINPVLRESVRDYLINAQFRKDIFIKGARVMPPLALTERFKSIAFVLTTPVELVPLKLQSSVGEVTCQESVYKPLLEMLAERSYAPKTVSELATHQNWQDKTLVQLVQALIILAGSGHAHPVQDVEAQKKAKPRCKALNAHVCQLARYGGDVAYLASPVIGAGVAVGRFQQLFLLARAQGKKTADDWASFTWKILDEQNQRIIRDGLPLEPAEDNLAELVTQAQEFAGQRLVVLRALGIAE